MSGDGDPIVAAYLDAKAEDARLDKEDRGATMAGRRAAFLVEAARNMAMSWGIQNPQHGALVALLAAERLQDLITGYAVSNSRGGFVLELGVEERFEVKQISDALLSLWRHLDPGPAPALKAYARAADLIDDSGNAVG